MEHVVFYPTADGVSAFERVNSLEAAVSFVEHLRNSENISEFQVHALTPVPLAFRAYYRVEVPEAADEPVAEARVVGVAVEVPAVEPVPSGPFASAPPVTPAADVPNGDVVPIPSGKRSMGFFAR